MEDFTSKWLERIDTAVTEGFARMEAKLEQKADKSDVQFLSTEISKLGGRVRSLEDKQLSDDVRKEAHEEHVDNQIHTTESKRDIIKTNIALGGTVLTFVGLTTEIIRSLIR